jgi:hypothetical protein
MSTSTYPVHVDATLDIKLSRWLWLVKWVLAIPHYFVLAFLWLAFFVLSVVAFFAILFTGRYPHGIFDFNVGVLRWSWRVAYYTYGALATDRYPPFTLGEVPDYPAHFTVDYPEHLSRGLVLVKWWLLAIPHYLIVAFLAGSGAYIAWDASSGEPTEWTWGGGLIGLLAFIAAVVLLFTGRYPQQIFDLVLGLNRWVLRVAAYAALMTDEYPPFRLDMGGPDPDGGRMAVPSPPGTPPAVMTAAPPATPTSTTSATTPPAPTGESERSMTDPNTGPTTGPNAGPAAAPPPVMPTEPATGQAPPPAPSAGGGGTRWGAGRVVTVIIASLLFLVAGGFLVSATTLAVGGATLRDDQGFLMTPTQTLSTESYALASEPLNIDPGATDVMPRSWLGEVAVRGDSTGGDDLFIGVASESDAAAYLADVRHATLTDIEGSDAWPWRWWGADNGTPVYSESGGAAPTELPGDSDIWVASATGTGEQELNWDPEAGDWTVVVMNADGSQGVSAEMSVGAELPVLWGVVVGLFVAGGLLLVISIVMLVLALRRRPETT